MRLSRMYRWLPPIGVVCGLVAAFALRTTFHHEVIVHNSGPTIIVNTSPNQVGPVGRVTPTIEMAFVLDTTGSMGGLIDAAKQKIWCIINSVMQSPCHPKVRVGLVAYRDHGDVYITKTLQMTNDLDKVYSTLMQYRAEGGGDTPEDVRQAMTDAVHKVGWSRRTSNMTQIMFLVGDAPPHNDYADEPDCITSTREAVQRGIVVNAIECGDAQDTKLAWQQIAQYGQGKFMAIAENGGVQQISTPYDDDLSRLGSRVGSTYVAYGGLGGGGGSAGAAAYRAGKMESESRMESTVSAAAPASAKADRAYNKAINSEAYDGDLLLDVQNGKVTVDKLKSADLPDDMQKLQAPALKAEIDRRISERKQLQSEIIDLSKKRDAYIADARKKLPGASDGFDAVVAAAIKKEASGKGVNL